MQSNAELIIITGGSEIVSLAIADAARRAAIPYAVFSLVDNSLLRKAPGCTAWIDLHPLICNPVQLREAFLSGLAGITHGRSTPIAILPTDDGSLRILNEYRDDVLSHAEFSRARSLRMGGIDKAEVAEAINGLGILKGISPTLVLDKPSDAINAFDAYGNTVVFKPALKPFNMDLSGMSSDGSKVVTQKNHSESPESVMHRLHTAWPVSQRWVAQPRMLTGANLERSVCAVRSIASINACQVVERAKFPPIGGTAFWVSTENKSDLIPSASQLLQALDVIGICELSYLPDTSEIPHMIEFNPRPWLQIELVEQCCFPIITNSIATLAGKTANLSPPPEKHSEGNWIQLERAALAAGSLQMTPSQLLALSLGTMRHRTIIAGYSSSMPGARMHLAKRAFGKLKARR